MAAYTVLVTAASRRVPLVKAFQRAVADLFGDAGRVVVADVNPMSPAVHVVERAYRVPFSTEPGYVDAVLAICRAEGVALVIPTIDDEVPVFGEAVRRFAAEGIVVACPPAETAAICVDKFTTCNHLRAHGVAAAATYLPSALPRDLELPLFVKPRAGRGSIGAFAARTRRELDFFLGYVGDPVVQEYLDGAEYTIDVLCDFDGQPISVVPRERVVIRAGVIDRGRTVADDDLIALAVATARQLRFHGAINIQCRRARGVPTIFEINARFAGGIPLAIAAGADFPRWLIQLARGEALSPRIGQFTPDLWMTNYDTGIFLPRAAVDVLRPVPSAD